MFWYYTLWFSFLLNSTQSCWNLPITSPEDKLSRYGDVWLVLFLKLTTESLIGEFYYTRGIYFVSSYWEIFYSSVRILLLWCTMWAQRITWGFQWTFWGYVSLIFLFNSCIWLGIRKKNDQHCGILLFYVFCSKTKLGHRCLIFLTRVTNDQPCDRLLCYVFSLKICFHAKKFIGYIAY